MDATCLFLKRTSIICPGVFLFGERVSGVFLRTLDLHHGCLFSVLSQSKYMDGRINRACTRGEGVLVVTDSFTCFNGGWMGGFFFFSLVIFPSRLFLSNWMFDCFLFQVCFPYPYSGRTFSLSVVRYEYGLVHLTTTATFEALVFGDTHCRVCLSRSYLVWFGWFGGNL